MTSEAAYWGQAGPPLPFLSLRFPAGVERLVSWDKEQGQGRKQQPSNLVSVPCFRIEWKRERQKVLRTEQNERPEPRGRGIPTAGRQSGELRVLRALRCVLARTRSRQRSLLRGPRTLTGWGRGTPFSFSSSPPPLFFKGSSLLTVLSLFPQYQNI